MIRLSPDKKKFQFVQETCHTRLNKFGEMSLCNRYDRIKTLKTQSNTSLCKEKSHKKSLISSIKNTSDIPTNPQTTNQIQTIKRLGLIGGLNLKQIKYEGHIKIPTVHNDYHASSSNPGYSRKPDGGIYPK